MSSTTDIEMAYSPDGSDALTSSDGSSALSSSDPTNGDLLKMLMEMKKEMNKQNTDHHKRAVIILVIITIIMMLSFINLAIVFDNNKALYFEGEFRCNALDRCGNYNNQRRI